MRTDFARSRDHLAGGLADAGFAVLPAEGTYFLPIDLAASGIPLDDVTFCERAVRAAGVAAIPASALFAVEPARTVLRLCFANRAAPLERPAERRVRTGRGRTVYSQWPHVP